MPTVKPGSHEPTSIDRDAFVAMVDTHGAALLATLCRLCENRHDADDLFQETAVRVWRSFATRPVLRSPRAWLITIGYRAFLDSRKSADCYTTDSFATFVDARASAPEELIERAESNALLNERVGELPAHLREVIALHYHGGLTIRQTAAAMQVSLAITKNRLHAALKELRSTLE